MYGNGNEVKVHSGVYLMRDCSALAKQVDKMLSASWIDTFPTLPRYPISVDERDLMYHRWNGSETSARDASKDRQRADALIKDKHPDTDIPKVHLDTSTVYDSKWNTKGLHYELLAEELSFYDNQIDRLRLHHAMSLFNRITSRPPLSELKGFQWELTFDNIALAMQIRTLLDSITPQTANDSIPNVPASIDEYLRRFCTVLAMSALSPHPSLYAFVIACLQHGLVTKTVKDPAYPKARGAIRQAVKEIIALTSAAAATWFIRTHRKQKYIRSEIEGGPFAVSERSYAWRKILEECNVSLFSLSFAALKLILPIYISALLVRLTPARVRPL